jgi:sugar phosphate isomerase/epimerase
MAIKFAFCNETYEDTPFDETCRDIKAAGYDGVEVAPFTLAPDPTTLTEADAERTGRIAREAGLEVVGLHWLLLQPQGLHLVTDDEAVRRRTTDFARHLVRLCHAMGGNVMVWGSPKQRWIADDQPRERAWKNAVDVLRNVCELAGEMDVTIALEPLSTKEANLLTSAAETVQMIEEIDHPAARLHLDVKAMCAEDKPIEQVIRDNSKYLAHFHANDSNLRGPGYGETDYQPIADALHDIGYDGYVSVEVFDYRPSAQEIARESIKYLREKFGATHRV